MILYFSATGNSKYVAMRVAEAIGDETASIVDCLRDGVYTFELDGNGVLGIVAPTYAGGLPEMVERYLDGLEVENAKPPAAQGKPYVFFAGTYGKNVGQTGHVTAGHLRARGITLDARFSVRMPDTWTPIFDLSDAEEVARINAEAEPQIDAMIEKVRTRAKGDFMQDKLATILAAPYHAAGYQMIRKTSNFAVSENCIGCGLCERICPDHTIEMQEGHPVWVKDRCQACLACLHRCPKFAIRYGDKTAGHGQYVNPRVGL